MDYLASLFSIITHDIPVEWVKAGYGWNAFTYIQIIGVATALIGNMFVNRMDIKGKYFWIVSNVILTGVQIHSKLYIPAILQFCFLIMTIQGIIMWRKIAKAREAEKLQSQSAAMPAQ